MNTANEFNSTARENIDNMMKKVKDFCDGNEQYDDMTMLNLIYKGNDKVETNEFVVDAIRDNWSAVYDFLAKDMTDKKIEKDRKLKILLAGEEIFVNIASYAYEQGQNGKAWIKTEKTDTTYDISFIDTGKQYNPLEKKDPNIDIALEDRTEGGLGVYLVKKLVDEVSYRYENSQNIFTISINL
jgi:sigma-B regulation protein RsbU (phosphoserine phosphatase)